jgi:hypothetical protein
LPCIANASKPTAQKSLAAQKHIATLVLSRSPFSASDVEALEKAAVTYEYEILTMPNRAPTSSVRSHIVGAVAVLASIVALALSLALAE